jgi:hypothetical protein
VYQNFIHYVCEAQHVSGGTPPIIRSLKLHWQPLVFYTWKVVGRVVGGQRPPTTLKTLFTIYVKLNMFRVACCPKHVELHINSE